MPTEKPLVRALDDVPPQVRIGAQAFRFNEHFQRCLSRVRTALATDVMRLGLIRDLRKIRQDFSHAMPRSTGARDVASARLTVR